MSKDFAIIDLARVEESSTDFLAGYTSFIIKQRQKESVPPKLPRYTMAIVVSDAQYKFFDKVGFTQTEWKKQYRYGFFKDIKSVYEKLAHKKKTSFVTKKPSELELAAQDLDLNDSQRRERLIKQ